MMERRYIKFKTLMLILVLVCFLAFTTDYFHIFVSENRDVLSTQKQPSFDHRRKTWNDEWIDSIEDRKEQLDSITAVRFFDTDDLSTEHVIQYVRNHKNKQVNTHSEQQQPKRASETNTKDEPLEQLSQLVEKEYSSGYRQNTSPIDPSSQAQGGSQKNRTKAIPSNDVWTNSSESSESKEPLTSESDETLGKTSMSNESLMMESEVNEPWATPNQSKGTWAKPSVSNDVLTETNESSETYSKLNKVNGVRKVQYGNSSDLPPKVQRVLENPKFQHCQKYQNANIQPWKETSNLRWVKLDAEEAIPKYDYRTCPVMKMRYNCAETQEKGPSKPTDYRLMFVDEETDERCDFREMLNVVKGGPFRSIRRSRISGDKILNVVLHGDSFLRQLWEAMVCGFRDQITDGLVQIAGPRFDVDSVKKREKAGEILTVSDIGKIIPLINPLLSSSQDGIVGCHGYGDAKSMLHFFGHEFKLSDALQNCNDDVSMVEFDSSVRIYYFFHAFDYERGVEDVYESVGLDSKDVDVIVTNNMYDLKTPGLMDDQVHRKDVWKQRIHFEPTRDIRPLQERDLGKWWGADNPGIKKSPDIHACMPGVPDDTVNLLLFSLMMRSNLDAKFK